MLLAALLAILGLYVILKTLYGWSTRSNRFIATRGVSDRDARTHVAGACAAPLGRYFLNTRGFYLRWDHWPIAVPTFNVLIVHGVGEYGRRYSHVARALNKMGGDCYSVDHIGHGSSEGERLFVGEFGDYIDDLETFLDTVMRPERVSAPLFLVAHSMGGLIGILLLKRRPGFFSGAVLSAPAVDANASWAMKRAAVTIDAVLPKMPISFIDPEGLSYDVRVVDSYVNDPCVVHAGINAHLAAEMLRAVDSLFADVSVVDPFLLMRGDDDPIVGFDGVQRFFDEARAPDKRFIRISHAKHEILNSPAAVELALDWISQRIPLT